MLGVKYFQNQQFARGYRTLVNKMIIVVSNNFNSDFAVGHITNVKYFAQQILNVITIYFIPQFHKFRNYII